MRKIPKEKKEKKVTAPLKQEKLYLYNKIQLKERKRKKKDKFEFETL